MRRVLTMAVRTQPEEVTVTCNELVAHMILINVVLVVMLVIALWPRRRF